MATRPRRRRWNPECLNTPKFTFKVVASYKDALTRQVSEAVRIDTRGGGILNSKTEYSRCRLPRLTIDVEEWRRKRQEAEEAAKDASRKLDGDATEIMDDGAAATKLEDKRKIAQHEQEGGGRKRKRRKLDLLADWGELTGYGVSGASGEDDHDQGLDMIPQHVPQLVPKKVNVITTRVARKQLNIMGFTMSGRELLERMVNSWVEVDLLDILWNRLECREWGREIVDYVLEVDVMDMVMGKQVVEEILGDGLVVSDFDREMIVPESTKAGQGVQKKEVGADKSEPEPKKKKKATKKELLAMASLGCMKITSWCRSVGQDDANTHVLDDQQMPVA